MRRLYIYNYKCTYYTNICIYISIVYAQINASATEQRVMCNAISGLLYK